MPEVTLVSGVEADELDPVMWPVGLNGERPVGVKLASLPSQGTEDFETIANEIVYARARPVLASDAMIRMLTSHARWAMASARCRAWCCIGNRWRTRSFPPCRVTWCRSRRWCGRSRGSPAP